MCIKKNKICQKVNGNNYGKIIGGDVTEIHYNNKTVQQHTNIYFLPPEKDKRDYSEEYKNYINSFAELEGFLYKELLGKGDKKYEFVGDYLNFAKSLLNWCIGKQRFPNEYYKLFCEELKKIYKIKEDDIIVKRWQAMNLYFSSQINESVNIYIEILKNKDNLNCSDEILDDVLIDGRNILIEKEQLNNKFLLDNPFQVELQKHSRKLSMPIYDRIKSDSYENVLKDTFCVETKSDNEFLMGSRLEFVLDEIQNLIYNAVFYGSITHLKLCREVIANVMYAYSKIYHKESFYKVTLRMLALSGEYNEYKKLCLYLGDSLKFWHSKEFINEIVALRNNIVEYKIINHQTFIYGFYAKYLDNVVYTKLENDVLKYACNVKNNNINLVHEILKSIRSNLNRASKKEEFMDLFEIIIREGYTRYFYDLAPILNNMKVENMKEKLYRRYAEIVHKILKVSNDINLDRAVAQIIRRGGFSRKFYRYKNEPSIKEILALDNSINDDYVFFDRMIKNFQERYEEKEKKPQIIIAPSITYTLSREYFNQTYGNKSILELIDKKYLPLVSSIFKSKKQTNGFKLEQLRNLLYISSVEKYKDMREKILDIIDNLNYGYGNEKEFINCFHYCKTNNSEIDLYRNCIKVLLNRELKINDMITNCFEGYFANNVSLSTVVECLQIIGNLNKNKEGILEQIYCFYITASEETFTSNLEIIKLLCVFSNTNLERKAIEILENISVDCSLEVAKTIMSVVNKYDAIKVNKVINNLKECNNIEIKLLIDKYERK